MSHRPFRRFAVSAHSPAQSPYCSLLCVPLFFSRPASSPRRRREMLAHQPFSLRVAGLARSPIARRSPSRPPSGHRRLIRFAARGSCRRPLDDELAFFGQDRHLPGGSWPAGKTRGVELEAVALLSELVALSLYFSIPARRLLLRASNQCIRPSELRSAR